MTERRFEDESADFQRGYREGWNDREDDLIAGVNRIAPLPTSAPVDDGGAAVHEKPVHEESKSTLPVRLREEAECKLGDDYCVSLLTEAATALEEGYRSACTNLGCDAREAHQPARCDLDGQPVTPRIEAACRAMHEELVGDNADEPLHHPAQNSWEEPTMVGWQQWIAAVRAVDAALASGEP
jgi:hypothetical protein